MNRNIDVVRTVILYTQFLDLKWLFMREKLDFKMKFKYDASDYIVRVIDVCSGIAFSDFPNIVLIGLSIQCMRSRQDVVRISDVIDSMKCYNVEKMTFYGCNMYENVFVDLFGLNKCHNLKYFKTRHCYILSISVLTSCVKLKYVDMMMCECREELGGRRKKMGKIQHLIMPWRARISLCRFPKLMHFCGDSDSIINYDDMSCVLDRNKLKSIMMHCMKKNILVPNLTIYSELEFFGLYDCESLKGLEILKECKKLRCVVFNKCGDVINARILGECKGLMMVLMRDCTNIINIDSLFREGVTVWVMGCNGITDIKFGEIDRSLRGYIGY